MQSSHTPWGQSTPFPVCPLHGHRLVDGLPAGCPYRAEPRMDALATLQDKAYARLMQADPSGLDLLRQVEVCEACRLPSHVLERLKRPRGSTPAPSPDHRVLKTRPVTMRLVRRRRA